jgi:hypothetical protein
MTAARRYTREQILALPPSSTLADLAACFGVSEPVIRRALVSGELAALGIKVNKLGAQHRVVTASVLAYLGLADGASTAPASRAGAGQRGPAAPALRSVKGRAAAP